MNQETFSRIIEAGQPVPITSELMSAARESAHRQRSGALLVGVRWVHGRAKAIAALLPPITRHQTSPI